MTSNLSQIVQNRWNYCNVLRDDKLSYGDYVQQLTCLLFFLVAFKKDQLAEVDFCGFNDKGRAPIIDGQRVCATSRLYVM